MTDKYTALLAKLKEATGPFDLADAVNVAFDTYPDATASDSRIIRLELALRGSLSATGAALALVELEFPGWTVGIFQRNMTEWNADVFAPDFAATGQRCSSAFLAPTASFAILMAWCEAMIAKEQSK